MDECVSSHIEYVPECVDSVSNFSIVKVSYRRAYAHGTLATDLDTACAGHGDRELEEGAELKGLSCHVRLLREHHHISAVARPRGLRVCSSDLCA